MRKKKDAKEKRRERKKTLKKKRHKNKPGSHYAGLKIVVVLSTYTATHLSSNRGSFQKKTLDWEDNQTLINCTQMTFAVIGSGIPKEMK